MVGGGGEQVEILEILDASNAHFEGNVTDLIKNPRMRTKRRM